MGYSTVRGDFLLALTGWAAYHWLGCRASGPASAVGLRGPWARGEQKGTRRGTGGWQETLIKGKVPDHPPQRDLGNGPPHLHFFQPLIVLLAPLQISHAWRSHRGRGRRACDGGRCRAIDFWIE